MKILVVNQNYAPDESATAQYLTDYARALVARGHLVEVLCSSRGYLNPESLYPKQEVIDGVRVNRVTSLTNNGKSRWMRILSAVSLHLNILRFLIIQSRYDVVIVLTSPPLIVCTVALVKGLVADRLVHWAMDLNPDQAIAAGWIRPHSWKANILNFLSRCALSRCDHIVTLDAFMKVQLEKKGIASEKIAIGALWADESLLAYQSKRKSADSPPEQRKFIVMYSGNMSLCHPLESVLQAATLFSRDSGVQFIFSGGGPRRQEVQDFIRSHPEAPIEYRGYVNRSDLASALDIADVQIVSMGEEFVGIVHPSKIYGILAMGKQFIYVGPRRGPIAAIVESYGVGVAVEHGDVSGLVEAISQLKRQTNEDRQRIESQIREVGQLFRAVNQMPVVLDAVEAQAPMA